MDMYSIAASVLDRAKAVVGIGERGLSEAAQAKILTIRQRGNDTEAASLKLGADINELTEAKNLTLLNIGIEEEHVGRLRNPSDADSKRLRQHQAELGELNAELARLQSVRTERVRELQLLRDLSAALMWYVSRLPKDGSVKRFEQRIDPQLSTGEMPSVAIELRRRRIRDLLSDQDAIRVALYPSAEAKQRARSTIKDLAEAGRANVLELVRRRGSISWPIENKRSEVWLPDSDRRGITSVEMPNTTAMFACLFPDQMAQYLDREIDLASDDERALTDEQRVARSAQIAADILLLEREEEALIERMEAQGASFMRRVDADPRAILGLSSAMPKPRTGR